MRTIEKMATYAKGIMLAAFMTVGLSAVNAQEEGGNTETGSESKTYAPATASDFWRGENVENTKEAYVFNVGAKTFITNDNTAKETDIKNASVWTITNNNDTYAFNSDNYKINMEGTNLGATSSWSTSISTSAATNFTLEISGNTDNGTAYKLKKTIKVGFISKKDETRYLNVDGSKYSAAKTKSTYNDWLFISATQKEAYEDYTSLYNEAISLLGNEKLAENDEVKQTLETALEATAASDYSKYENDAKTLKDAIAVAKKAIEDIPNGIHCIKPATAGEAKVAAIYGMNGVRNAQLTKGINIVKMNDGSVKKVLVK